jgi:hypothetical protein
MGKLSSAMQRLVEKVRFSADARHGALGVIRCATRAALDRSRRERRDNGCEARRSARRQVAEIRGAVSRLKHSARSVLGCIAADVQAATELWRNASAARGGGPVCQSAVTAAPPPAAAWAGELARQSKSGKRERVLGIVRGHVDGIRLVDIGNELGVDWRSLVGVAKSLLEEGTIEKIDCLYYPVED